MVKMLLVFAALAWAVPMAAMADTPAGKAPSQTVDDRVLGQDKAPITIFEYASLTCPHCAEFNVDTLPKLKAAWIDTGKAKLIYRDYPLDQLALRAAVLARCAPPERFYAFIDALFHSQDSWATASDTRDALAKIGRLGGVDEQQFNQCMNDQKLADKVVAERLVAQDQYGVDSTPTFFINGTKVVGAQSYETFNQTLTAAASASGIAAPPPPAAATPAAATPAATPAAAPATPAAAPPPPVEEGWLQKVKHWFGW